MGAENQLDSKYLQHIQKRLTLQNLRIILGILGLVPIMIGGTGIFFGLDRLVPGADFSSAADGQFRYLSAIYLGFGCLIIWIQFRLGTEIQLFRILMVMVFIAGVARSLPIFNQELPSIRILVALAFEIVAPPLLILWHNKVVDPAALVHGSPP